MRRILSLIIPKRTYILRKYKVEKQKEFCLSIHPKPCFTSIKYIFREKWWFNYIVYYYYKEKLTYIQIILYAICILFYKMQRKVLIKIYE
jgi:hypothetical protein